MTHTLHRIGQQEDLHNDFVIMSMAAQEVNRNGASEKIRKVFEILLKHHAVNFGEIFSGPIVRSSEDEMRKNIKDNSYVHFVFDDVKNVIYALSELKEADIGLSVVVSGLVDEVNNACKESGLSMHTVELSGGIFGRKDLLADRPILEITTMCGHGLISANLVVELIKKIKNGKTTIQDASIELAKQCQCGVFNIKRAENVILKLIQTEQFEGEGIEFK